MDLTLNIQLIDFGHCRVAAAATPNEDGSLTIFLNARVSHEKLAEAYQHELRHYYNNDFHADDVDLIESSNQH